MDEYSRLGGYDSDVAINTVCSGLKINETILNSIYSNLSGGEKTLVQLAKALLIKRLVVKKYVYLIKLAGR